MSRLSFGQGFAQNWHQTVPRWTYSGLGLVFGVLVWFFPHILKFIFFWAGNKVFSFLQLHVTLPKKHIKKIIQYIFFLAQTQNVFQAPSCHLQRKPDIFWPTGEVQKHFSFGKQQYRNSSEGTGHRGSCCYGVTLTRSRCATCQVWYPLSNTGMPLEDRGKAEQPSRITVWHCPVRNRPGQAQSFWEHFGCTVGSSLQLILPWRNTGGSLELHLLWN